MISLLAAMMLVSSCGTSPRADLLSESRVTSDLDEAQGESEMAHYLIGGAVVIVALCTVVPGAKSFCKRQIVDLKRFTDGLDGKITKLQNEKVADGVSTEKASKIQDKIDKLKDIKKKANKSGKDGIFFTVYDKTIGSIVRKIRKTDDAGGQQNAKGKSNETANATDETAESADAGNQGAKSGGDDAKATEGDDAGQQSAKSKSGEAKATDDTAENAGDSGQQSTDQQK